MAHEVETLFYNYGKTEEEHQRLTPWHGLGTPVEEAPNSYEALRIAGLNWKVESKPVFVNDKEVPNYVANVRDSDNSVLGIVTNRYKIVQNEDAFAFTDALISGDVRYETAGSLKNGKRIWLLAKLPETKVIDDVVVPYVCFTNTHDGTGAVQAIMSPIRVVCNNTLNLALTNAKRSWSMRHVGDINGKIEEAREVLGLADKYMKELNVFADKLANTSLPFEKAKEIVNELFPIDKEDSDREKRNMQKCRDDIMVCYFAPDILKYQNTAYGLVNAVTDWAGHKTPLRNTKSYQENNFGRILDGHPVVDAVVEKVSALV